MWTLLAVLPDVLLIALVVAIAALPFWVAVKLDLRTRRGYFLGVLALLLLALTIWLGVAATTALEHAGTDMLAAGLVVIAYWFALCVVALVLVVAALVAARLSRQMRWMLAIAVVALTIILIFIVLPLFGIAGDVMRGRWFPHFDNIWLIPAIPLLAVLIYAIARTVRPVAVRPNMPAPELR